MRLLMRSTQMAGDMDWNIYAVHVNHGLRPVAADDDQRYVEELCARKKYLRLTYIKQIVPPWPESLA